MRAVSAAVVMLSGAVLAAAACAPGLPGHISCTYGITGGVVGAVGLLGWVMAYFRDASRP